MAVSAYVERLLDDDYVQEQISEALERGRRAYQRARSERAAEAVQDKKLMEHLTEAARSLQEAARRLAGRPEPKPRRRGLRTAGLFVTAVGVGALAVYLDGREAAKARARTAPRETPGAVRAPAAV
jgi:ferric-dicitrate binding protein FerR (iron transport regulator)